MTIKEGCRCNCVDVGAETWSLTLKEEYRLRFFEKTVLKKVFGAEMKSQEAARNCTLGGFVRCQMKEDELHGVCGTRGRGENAYRVWFGIERKRNRFEKPRRKWECNTVEPGYNDIGLYEPRIERQMVSGNNEFITVNTNVILLDYTS